ncbi:hypothetical protein DFA_11735 [Cavenderia fasciculata]|uniref:Uncharacterized protein n=1 Tax=Cavenderia fasciculata TaxID=261658 RepID=F4QE27_CACFS|nr:uncharacterized protein DFA_11735 [Cavenderia fasciculata]EGG13974.1 hypothetical protein DFA_11735 [Cavenderia fasciculata]|eukprot:XP_004350682.1 hypothetical protein DFA_11735 [Cavenderia fasciculata]
MHTCRQDESSFDEIQTLATDLRDELEEYGNKRKVLSTVHSCRQPRDIVECRFVSLPVWCLCRDIGSQSLDEVVEQVPLLRQHVCDCDLEVARNELVGEHRRVVVVEDLDKEVEDGSRHLCVVAFKRLRKKLGQHGRQTLRHDGKHLLRLGRYVGLEVTQCVLDHLDQWLDERVFPIYNLQRHVKCATQQLRTRQHILEPRAQRFVQQLDLLAVLCIWLARCQRRQHGQQKLGQLVNDATTYALANVLVRTRYRLCV